MSPAKSRTIILFGFLRTQQINNETGGNIEMIKECNRVRFGINTVTIQLMPVKWKATRHAGSILTRICKT